MNVLVIGGGITGLSAAFELAARGIPVTLLEGADRAGGLILTEHIEGFTIEAGPDSMLAQKPAALRLCEDLGLGPRLIATSPPRRAYVLAGNRLHALPSPSVLGLPTTWRGIAAFDLLPAAARLRLAVEPLVRSPAPADESIAAFFRRRFGAASVELVAEPLLGGIHAGDVEALSVRSLFPRLVEAEARHGSVLRAFRRTRPGAGSDGSFRSLAAGMGELVLALERRLPEGSIRRATPATALRPLDGGGWRVFSGREAFDARAVILAVPAHVSASLLAPVDRLAADLCAEVPYASTASVVLAWRRAAIRHPLDGSGYVVARRRSEARITACTWVSSKWEGRAPAGYALVRAFIGGVHDPQAASLDDSALVEIAVRDLAATLGVEGAPVLARVYRWPRAGAQHNVGQLARVARIEERLAAFAGLFVAGSGFRSVGIPDCIADGRASAAAAAACVKMGPADGAS